MKVRRSIGVAGLVAAVSLCLGAVAFAGTKSPEVADMESPGSTKGVVHFEHQKHIGDYKLGCGECHHDDKGQPLTGLKDGDDVQKCFDCHNQPGEVKGKNAAGLSKQEKLAHIGNATHDNCIGCHKDFKKKNPATEAPTSKCNDCHAKSK